MAAGGAIGCFGLTESHGGSDPSIMKTHAKRDGGDWVINGSKMWITNGGIADVAVGVKTTLIIESSSKTLGVGVGGGGAMTKLRRLFRAFFFWRAAARTVDPE